MTYDLKDKVNTKEKPKYTQIMFNPPQDWGTKYHNSREIVSHIIPEYAIDEVNIDTIYYL